MWMLHFVIFFTFEKKCFHRFFTFGKHFFTGFSPGFSPVFHGAFTEVHGCVRRGAEGDCFCGGCGAHICPPPSVACGPDPALLAMRKHWGSTVTVQLQELSHLGDHARIETLLPEQQAQSNTFAIPLQKRMHTLDCESHVIPSLTTTFIFR